MEATVQCTGPPVFLSSDVAELLKSRVLWLWAGAQRWLCLDNFNHSPWFVVNTKLYCFPSLAKAYLRYVESGRGFSGLKMVNLKLRGRCSMRLESEHRFAHMDPVRFISDLMLLPGFALASWGLLSYLCCASQIRCSLAEGKEWGWPGAVFSPVCPHETLMLQSYRVSTPVMLYKLISIAQPGLTPEGSV